MQKKTRQFNALEFDLNNALAALDEAYTEYEEAMKRSKCGVIYLLNN